MLYLNTSDIQSLSFDWHALIDQIETAVRILHANDYSQPIKPYLRYNEPQNRIIAMPAYLGGTIRWAGIKWIASFPSNISSGMQRAHAVTILNNPDNGKPMCTVNSTATSSLRTAAVSGLLVREYVKHTGPEQLEVGITGGGPIGKMHLKILHAILGSRVRRYRLFDIIPVTTNDLPKEIQDKLEITPTWTDAYVNADIFVTCTVSRNRYIDLPPKRGSLQLNVSLRDYLPSFRQFVDTIVVDDWQEVCRENTDIERMHIEEGLTREETKSIIDVVVNDLFSKIEKDNVVMFNPMGMGIFDMCTTAYFYHLALDQRAGVVLND